MIHALALIESKNIHNTVIVWAFTHIGRNAKILEGTTIGTHCSIDCNIGVNCKVQSFVFAPNGVEIGNNVFVGPHVCFTNDKKPIVPIVRNDWKITKTIVEDNVSIGAGSVILPGITLHTGCKIGAGAVVTKSVRSHHVVVGNPAHKI